MKKIKTSRREITEDDMIDFEIDDDTFTAIRPKMSQVMKIVGAADASVVQQVSRVEKFLESVLTTESWERLEDRLEDPDDGLEFDHMIEIMNGIIEDFADRPTESSSASSGGRTTKKSTARSSSKG